MQLAQKTAVVTGAGTGMGKAIARRLAAEGAAVAVIDIDGDSAERTVSELENRQDCFASSCDISDSAAVGAVFDRVREQFGKLDILVNNAGVGTAPGDGQDRYMETMAQRGAELAAGKTPTVFADKTIHMEDRGWQRVLDINLNGCFFCSREAVRLMIDSGCEGAVINISSTSALNGDGGLHYCTSKAAIIGLTRAMAMELAPRNIRVNAVCPGPTNTDQMKGISAEWAQSIIAAVPLSRMAEPEEIASTVLFLAADSGALYTGQTLACNGGMHLL